MKAYREIFRGWLNYTKMFAGVLDEKTKLRSKERIKKCMTCEYLKNGKCQPCGCPIVPKSMSELNENNKCYSNLWQS